MTSHFFPRLPVTCRCSFLDIADQLALVSSLQTTGVSSILILAVQRSCRETVSMHKVSKKYSSGLLVCSSRFCFFRTAFFSLFSFFLKKAVHTAFFSRSVVLQTLAMWFNYPQGLHLRFAGQLLVLSRVATLLAGLAPTFLEVNRNISLSLTT